MLWEVELCCMIAKGVCSVCSLWGSGLVIGTVWGGECGAGDGSILGCVTNQSSNILPTVHTSCYPTPQQIQQVRAISIFPHLQTVKSVPHTTPAHTTLENWISSRFIKAPHV